MNNIRRVASLRVLFSSSTAPAARSPLLPSPSLLAQYLLKEGLIDGSCITCTGKTMAENLASCPDLSEGQEIILPIENPIKKTGHLQCLYGNIAPEGSVAKITGKEGLYFKGFAKCYDSEEEMLEALSEDPEWRNACCMGISVPDGDESYPRICAVGVAGTSEGRRRAALLALCIAALASPSPKVKRVRHLTDSEQEVANMFPGMMQRIQAVARGFLQKCRQAAFQLRFKDLLKARLAEDQEDRLASAFQQAWKNPCETKSYGALAPQADANCWRDPGWAIRVLDLPPTCTWWDVRDHCKRSPGRTPARCETSPSPRRHLSRPDTGASPPDTPEGVSPASPPCRTPRLRI